MRADFHLNTRADKEFEYEGDPKSFDAAYVESLAKSEIRVGVIANHNKFDREEFKTLLMLAEKKEILLLPGVELSLKDDANGIRAVVVFSPEWVINQENKDYISGFLDVRFPGHYESENGSSSQNLDGTLRVLNDFKRDYFLICGHTRQDRGARHELDGGRLWELAAHESFRERCLGVRKVRTRTLRDSVKSYMSDCYPAEVEGSDCKSIDQIGKGEGTYLKIGAFTFEAVKFALLDHLNRVATEPPRREHSYIREVIFEGEKLPRTTLHLSSGLNSFIGIRGSGKSSILESIRYALGVELPENFDRDGYKQGAVKHALGSGGKVTLKVVDRRGQEYEVRRILGEQPDVYLGGAVQAGINIRESVLHKPVYFGQKDLSSTGQGFENELVEKLVGDSLIPVRNEVAILKQAIVETVRRLQKLSDLVEKQKEYQSRQADAEQRLKVFKQHGVEEKLRKQVDFEQDNRLLKSLTEIVDGYILSLEDVVSQYQDDFGSRSKYQSKRNEQFFTEVMAIFSRVSETFAQMKASIEDAREASNELKGRFQAFQAIKGTFKEEFAEVARKLTEELKSSGAMAIEPDEFLKLQRAIDNSKHMLAALSKEKEQHTALQLQLLSGVTALNDKWHEEFRLIKDRLTLINNQGTALRIDIDYKGDRDAFSRYLKDIFRGSKLQDSSLDSLVNEFADGAAMYRELDRAKKVVGNSSDRFEQYFRENMSALLTWQVPNKFIIKYHGKELRYHSLGQRASALILFVLSQRENDVVIIDQPEDDLDNQTIYEDVIKLIRKLKPQTQFIVATHNPNIPVLGDAEQVFACAHSGDRINITMGSIDRPALQGSIVKIMEGGQEAFKERKRIYKLWKHQNS